MKHRVLKVAIGAESRGILKKKMKVRLSGLSASTKAALTPKISCSFTVTSSSSSSMPPPPSIFSEGVFWKIRFSSPPINGSNQILSQSSSVIFFNNSKKLIVIFLVSCFLLGIPAFRRSQGSSPTNAVKISDAVSVPDRKSIEEEIKKRGIQKFRDKFFDGDEIAVNEDGRISFNETYELILKMYINLNRQAPIKSPTREKLLSLFPTNNDGSESSISEDEFIKLAMMLYGTAFKRLAVHKTITLLGAPVLADFGIRKIRGLSWLQSLISKIMPTQFHKFVKSEAFWRTMIVVSLVSTLGNFATSSVDWILNKSKEIIDVARKAQRTTKSKKYSKIDDIEERAFEVLSDLGLVEKPSLWGKLVEKIKNVGPSR